LLKIREIFAKNVLTKTGIEGYDYCINPYVGCAHGCRYCYATFMKRFTGHAGEKWGSFLDVRVNMPEVLRKELRKKHTGTVLFGSVTDAYNPMEKRYEITRKCLEAIAASTCFAYRSDAGAFSRLTRYIAVFGRNENVGRTHVPSGSLPAGSTNQSVSVL
jgi:pyruvate-formate lyase-activating enzyme